MSVMAHNLNAVAHIVIVQHVCVVLCSEKKRKENIAIPSGVTTKGPFGQITMLDNIY